MKKKYIVRVIIGLVLIIFIFGSVDFYMVTIKKHKPLFSIGTKLEKDGGSGTYTGLGYSYEIKGNFMPDSEEPGVKEYQFKILGIKIVSNQNEKK